MPRSTRNRGPLERLARAALRDSVVSMRRIESCAASVAAAAEAAITCLQSGGTLYFCGNGGSAADAQHLAAELSGRYLVERRPLAATALTTNSSAVTAIGNDYGYDQVFSRQLAGVGRPGDVLVAITTSGGSANVLRAIDTARRLGMTVIGMTGSKGTAFARRCDHALVTPSPSTPRIQEGHIAMGHAWCALIELAMAERPASPSRARSSRRATAPRGGTARRRTARRSARRTARRTAGPTARRGRR